MARAASLKVDACKSCTVTQCTEPKYGKDEVEEYGEYYRDETIFYIDFENEIIHSITEQESYDNSKKEFTKVRHEEYYFKYNDAYYQWDNRYSEQAVVTAGTKAGFIELSKTPANEASQFSVYAPMKEMFNYNAETQSYELGQYGTMKMSIQFPDDGGVRMTLDLTSATQTVISFTGVDNTDVTVPTNVKADIDAFIAQQVA